jgi:hypothetical protein
MCRIPVGFLDKLLLCKISDKQWLGSLEEPTPEHSKPLCEDTQALYMETALTNTTHPSEGHAHAESSCD